MTHSSWGNSEGTSSPVGLLGAINVVGCVEQRLLLQQQQGAVGEGACARGRSANVITPVKVAMGRGGALRARGSVRGASPAGLAQAGVAAPRMGRQRRGRHAAGAGASLQVQGRAVSGCSPPGSHAASWPSWPSGPLLLGCPSRCTSNSGPAREGSSWAGGQAVGTVAAGQQRPPRRVHSELGACKGGGERRASSGRRADS